jgi:hypothetical protein
MEYLNQATGEMSVLHLHSNDLNELAKALAKAQASMTAAKLDGTNPHFKSSYATIASILSAIRKPLADNGLSVTQLVTPDGLLITMLMHESGQWLKSYYKIGAQQNTPQGVGSALTYARRYSLAALVGISQDDDDAEAGEREVKQTKPVPDTNPLPPAHWSASEKIQLKLEGNVAKLGATMEDFFRIHQVSDWSGFANYEGEAADAWAHFKEKWLAGPIPG